jgi:hypothetical protein
MFSKNRTLSHSMPYHLVVNTTHGSEEMSLKYAHVARHSVAKAKFVQGCIACNKLHEMQCVADWSALMGIKKFL